MGFFDRFYYGKAGKADYTEDDLPSNRFQLFFQVLRVRLWSLVRLNLMQVVFWIPFILITMLTLMQVYDIGIAMLEEEAAADGVFNQLLQLIANYAILLIPCILITGPSTAAASYVARNWARDQHSFLWSDFKDAFKANWKQGLLTSAMTSVLPYLMYIGFYFYGQVAKDMPVAVAAQVLLVMVGVVWGLALVMIYPLMVGYELRMRKLIRNSLLLAVGRLPFVLAIRLATLLPLIIGLVVTVFFSMYGLLFIVLYYLLIGFSLHRLVYASYANSVFDRYINPNIEGAPVNLGLREAEEDDGEPEA